MRRSGGGSTMNSLLITSQIVCYGLSIVSASVNIARFVRHRRSKAKRRVRARLLPASMAAARALGDGSHEAQCRAGWRRFSVTRCAGSSGCAYNLSACSQRGREQGRGWFRCGHRQIDRPSETGRCPWATGGRRGPSHGADATCPPTDLATSAIWHGAAAATGPPGRGAAGSLLRVTMSARSKSSRRRKRASRRCRGY